MSFKKSGRFNFALNLPLLGKRLKREGRKGGKTFPKNKKSDFGKVLQSDESTKNLPPK